MNRHPETNAREVANLREGGRDLPLDNVSLSVFWSRLVSIVNEASVAHQRTAFSTAVREGNDFAASLLDIDGGSLANSDFGLPNFVATQSETMRHFLRRFPNSEMRAGDVLITNEPWMATGHGLDLTLAQPIIHAGRLVAYAGSVAHCPDLGGVRHWEDSHDIFEEPLRILPAKLYEGGRPNETLMEMIRNNSRLPDLTMGDLDAQLASLHATSVGLADMLDEYGLEDLTFLANEMYSRSEAAMRAAISEIPDGTYRGEVVVDGYPKPRASDRSKRPDPIVIRATVTVAGSDLLVDFSGSSPQRAGPFNGIATNVVAYVGYYLRLILVPFHPNNTGYYRPIKVSCPPGSVVNATFPSGTLCRHVIGHQASDAVALALAPVIPDRLVAPSGSGPSWTVLVLGEGVGRASFESMLLLHGGAGATHKADGQVVGFPANTANTPIEVMETLVPLVCESKEIIADSGGEGRRRGGVGYRFVVRACEPLSFSILNGRIEHPALGLNGGGAGARGRVTLRRRHLPAGAGGHLAVGERLVLETPGGGGFGDPAERPLPDVQADIRDGIVSAGQAQKAYRIAANVTDLDHSVQKSLLVTNNRETTFDSANVTLDRPQEIRRGTDSGRTVEKRGRARATRRLNS